MNTLTKLIILTLGLTMGAPASFATENGLSVVNPWIREAPPLSKVLGGYLVLENKSERDRILTGATSPSFERVEMHRTKIHNGVAKMLHQDSLTVPAGQSVAFEPGAYHLMLIGPTTALRSGDQVNLSLSFADGEQIKASASVRKTMAGMGETHNMGDMKGMQTN
jgi:copper(I)-binding protein